MRHFVVIILVVVLLTTGAALCLAAEVAGVAPAPAAADVQAPAPGAPTPTPGYRISAGDSVSVVVWGQDRLSMDCQVNAAGTISYPLLGDVAAAGLTCSELQTRLTQGLQTYLKRPQVLVRMSGYGAVGASVFVLGEVSKPGVYPVSGANALMQAIAAAGGITSQASGQITIVSARTGLSRSAGIEQAAAGAATDPLAMPEPGDVVLVDRKADADVPRRYTVLGEVPTPGLFEMGSDAEVHVLDAMQKCGLLKSDAGADSTAGGSDGPFPRADLEHVLLTRGDIAVPLDLAALLRGDTTQDVLLQAGDVLTVPRRPLIAVYAVGEVRSPGRQLVPKGTTLFSFYNSIGGANPGARLGAATVVRQVDGKQAPVPVNIDRLLAGDAKQDLVLQEGDVLYIPAKGEGGKSFWQFMPLLPYLWR